MNDILQVQHDQKREIVFGGQLQQKITKTHGTLLRRKRTVYEDELWVALCVHDGGNGGIPHIEWYKDTQSVRSHRPLRVLDLLDCQYVNVVIGEERCFIIGFADRDRPVLELSAPSLEQRDQWITKLTSTLRQLNCIPDNNLDDQTAESANCYPRAENQYVPLNAVDESPPIICNGLPTSPALQSTSNSEAYPYVPIGPSPANSNSNRTQKRTLMDTIPMHASSSPSTPTFSSLPRSESTDHNNQSSVSVPNRTPVTSRKQYLSRPICIGAKPLDCKSRNQSNSANHLQHGHAKTIIDEEENEADSDDNKIEENAATRQEPLVPPPLPPRKSHQNQVQSQQQTHPALPSSPIPSSPPCVPLLNTPPEAQNYAALAHCSRPVDFRSQYDQLSPNGTAGEYQKLSRFSGDFSTDQSQQQQQQSTAAPSICMRSLHICSPSEAPDAMANSTTTTSSSARSSDNGTQISHQLQHLTTPPISSRSSLVANQYDILSNLPPPNLFINNSSANDSLVERIFLESMSQPRRVSLSLTLLVENVAFVDNGNKLWIAGWNPNADANLRNVLHFGDEVEKMNGVEIHTTQKLPEIYAKTKPGVHVELLLRANPRAKVFTLKMPANPKKELGIVFHKMKNKIVAIERNSPADRICMPTHLPPYFFKPGQDEVPAVITEVDGIPMRLDARNEQFFNRIKETRIGAPINLTIHPKDFCDLIARKLKDQHKNSNKFVHNF